MKNSTNTVSELLNLRERMKRYKISYQSIADEMNKSKATIWNAVNKEEYYDPDVVKVICDAIAKKERELSKSKSLISSTLEGSAA